VKTGSPTQVLDVEGTLSRTQALKIYGLSQQAKFGDVTGERPSAFDIRGRLKWDAWNVEIGKS
jgi:diazepam-binding inhibitor (GABA receptor modulating acyl-CoA-binding protein)